MYGSVNDRMRAMDHECLEILTGAGGTLLAAPGTVMLPGGLLFAAQSIIISADAIDYEVRRTLSLGS